MIEEPDEDNESEDEDSLFDADDEDDYFYEDTITSEEREEEALQSFRWFQQRLAQAELEEDVEGYTEDEHYGGASMEDAYNKNKRKIEILTERVKKIDKLPYDKLLAAFMSCCSDYTCNMYSNEMFKQVSSMVDDVHERIVNEGGYNEAAVVVPSS